jgi:outer membrane protein TolC
MIKQFDLIEKSKEMNLSNAARAYLPQFSMTGIASLVYGLSEMSMLGAEAPENKHHKFLGIAQLNQVIWDGGSTKARQKIMAATAEVDRQNIEVILYTINERINQIYLGILLIDEQLKQVDILDDNLSKNLKRAETACKNGTVYPSDLDKIRVEILNSGQSRINLNSQRKAYIEMLSVMINKNLDPDIQLNTLTDNGTVLTETINRPELSLYKQQRLLYDAQNLVYNSRIMPKIGLMGYAIGLAPGIKLGNSNMDHLLMAGVSLSWNIGGLYTRKNDRNIIKINQLMLDAQQEAFLFNTNLELKQSNEQVKRTKQLMDKDDEIISLCENIKRATEIKYENGACTMTDLVNDINAENMARQNKALHKIEYLMSIYIYKTISGN